MDDVMQFMQVIKGFWDPKP